MSLSAQNILNSYPFGFGPFMNTPERKVIILWDYESCPVPSGASGLVAVRNIREAALKFGSIDQFEAYSCWSNNPKTSIKTDLLLSGVQLRDCPHTGKKAEVSKTMAIDMMVYALERPRTTTVVLISSDRDYAYAISTLRNRGYPVKLLAPSGYLHSGLQALADILDWKSIFKPHLPPSELIDSSRLAGAEEEEEESEEEEEETEEEEDEEREEEEEDNDEEEEEEYEAEVPATPEQHEAKVHVEVVKELEVVRDVEVEEVKEPEPEPEPEPELLVQVIKEKEKQEVTEVKLGPFEFKSSPPPSPTWSEPAPLPAPAVILPTWTPAQAAPPSVIEPAPLPAPAVVLPTKKQEVVEVKFGPFEFKSSPPPSPTWSEPAPLPAPAVILPTWNPAQATPPSVIVPLEPLSARLQAQPVQKPLPPPVPSPTPPTQRPLSHPVLSPTPPAQPTAPPSYGGGSSPPGSGAHLLEKPARSIPPKFLALVQELEAMKTKGYPAPLWTFLSTAVKKRQPSVLEIAGVRKWKDYMLLAEKEGIVINGKTRSGTETTSLRV